MTSEAFDPRSGSLGERALFNHRWIVLLLCGLVTAALGWQATRLKLNATFEKTIPVSHPYVKNFLQYQGELSGLGNAVRIAVANPQGGTSQSLLYSSWHSDLLWCAKTEY